MVPVTTKQQPDINNPIVGDLGPSQPSSMLQWPLVPNRLPTALRCDRALRSSDIKGRSGGLNRLNGLMGDLQDPKMGVRKCTIFLAIWIVGIFPEIEAWKIGLFSMVGTSNLGTWNGHW